MNLKKSISLSIILTAVLLISISSINACDVNDNAGTDITLLGNHDDSGDYRNIAGLNYDDYYSTENTTATIDNTTSQDNIMTHNNHIDDLVVIENSNPNNNMNVENLINISDIVASGEYKVNQTSDNIFILTLADNTTLKVGMLQVFDLDSFKQVAKSISTKNCQFDALVIDFKNNIKLEFDPWSEELIKLDHVKNLIIRGNGAIISVRNPDRNNENHFLNVNTGATVWMSNITLNGFNTAILNYGTCQLTNTVFKNNQVDYLVEEDYAGAVRNWGILKCSECSFIGNYAKYGGAIYNDKGSQSTFVNCFFNDNSVYNRKKGCLETNDGDNIYTSPGASCLVLNHNDKIKCINIATQTDYQNFLYQMDNIGHVKFLILNFTSAEFYRTNQRPIYLPGVENLYIYGNGATISVKNSGDSMEYNFLKTVQGQFCSISNLTIDRFNTAILNKGSLSISDSHFTNNRIDYYIMNDYAGAIYNAEGLITISDTTFEGNYAKHGGAIYNDRGIISCKDCRFINNAAYGDGGAIYNFVGIIYAEGCNFTSNSAENGGAIFNHYGIMVLNNIIFNRSVAKDDGGAIYNDFGKITIGNCTFIDSQADEGREIFNYGDDAECIIIGESYVIRNGVLTKTLDITSDAPNEVLRWVIRGAEVALCVALVLVCGHFFSEAVAGAICFIGGGILAGVEELIEGVYLDHNFNIYNCLVMMAIAGGFDALSGAATSFIGRVCFKVVDGAVTVGSEVTFNAIGFCIDLVGEIVTEVLPRFDFSNNKLPTTILDLENPPIPC